MRGRARASGKETAVEIRSLNMGLYKALKHDPVRVKTCYLQDFKQSHHINGLSRVKLAYPTRVF
jgi:hypothetical protein